MNCINLVRRRRCTAYAHDFSHAFEPDPCLSGFICCTLIILCFYVRTYRIKLMMATFGRNIINEIQLQAYPQNIICKLIRASLGHAHSHSCSSIDGQWWKRFTSKGLHLLHSELIEYFTWTNFVVSDILLLLKSITFSVGRSRMLSVV